MAENSTGGFTSLLEHQTGVELPLLMRFHHAFILAGAGYGKSQLIQTLVYDHLESESGFCVIDCEGTMLFNISRLRIFDPHVGGVMPMSDRLLMVDSTELLAHADAVDLFEAVNRGAFILINTEKSLLEHTCASFGNLFFELLTDTLRKRARIPFDRKAPYFIYIDEAQRYLDDEDIASLLTQARKQHIGITVAHQELRQLSDAQSGSIRATTGIKLVGGVSAEDARVCAKDMGVDPGVIDATQKYSDHAEFVCWIREITPCGIRVDIPFGVLESMDTLNDEQYSELLERNNEKCLALFRK